VKGEPVSALESSLSAALESRSVVGVALVDAVTGLVYGVAGDPAALGDGERLAQSVGLLADGLHDAGAVGDFESVVTTTARRHQVVQAIPGRTGPLLLVLTLEREQTNLALALRAGVDLAAGLLAAGSVAAELVL
jgi:hypothetical protein